MRMLVVAVVFLAMSQLFGCAAPLVKVESGEKVVCSECGKLIRSDVQTKMVKQELASNFSVHEIKELCADCQRKKAEAIRLAKVRRIEQSRQRDVVRTSDRLVGEWHSDMYLGENITLRADGTGRWNQYETVWRKTPEGFEKYHKGEDAAKRRILFTGGLRMINGIEKLAVGKSGDYLYFDRVTKVE